MSGNPQLDPTIDEPNSSSVAGVNANHATQVTSPAGAGASAAAAGSPMFGPPVAEGEVGRLGRYRVLKKLGQGGMGAVYVAVDETLQRKIALKVMLPKFAANRDARERFLREARATAQLTHDNVVTIFEAAELDGLPFLAMQYLQGYPLDEFLKKKGTPPLPHVLRIGREVAAGLAAAHAVGLIHRDIKPGNLWLEAPNARVKILDFGLAKSLGGAADVELTQSGAIVGTPAYMSPEQARGEKLDGRSDLFSLGGVLYFLCGGRLPFTGPNMMAVLTALATTEPTPIRELNPNVSAELAALIHKLLAKNPADRPQSATEVVKLLDAARVARPQPTAPTAAPAAPSESPLVITAQPIDFFANLGIDPTSEISPRSAKAKSKSKSPAKPIPKNMWLAGAAVAVVLLGVLLAKVFNKDDSSATSNVAAHSNSIAKPKIKPSSTSQATRSNTKPVTRSPDRKFAEHILALPGSVIRVVTAGNQEPRDIRSATELPNEPFHVVYANVVGNPVSDTAVDLLLPLEKLNGVLLDSGNLNDAAIRKLLTAQSKSQWKILILGSSAMTDASVEAISQTCPDIEHLQLGGATMLTDAALSYLPKMRAIRFLSLGQLQITDDGLAALRQTRMTSLQLFSCPRLTGAAMRHVAALPDLKSLLLSATPIGDDGLTHLHAAKSLTLLELKQTQVTPAGIAKFKAALPKCAVAGDFDPDRNFAEHVVKIEGNHVDVLVPGVPNPVRAVKVADLPSGSFHVILAQVLSPFTEKEIELLLPLEHLTTLFFNFSTLNDDDIKRLLTAPSATNWTRLLVTSDMMTDDSVLAISQTCTSLESLSLKMCPLVTDAGLEHLSELPQLRILELVAVPITGQCFDRLRKNQFVELYIHAGVRLTDEGLQHIGAFTELERLLIIAPNVTDRGLEHLRPLAKLDGLQLTTPAATDRCLTTIGSLKSLTRLNLHNIPITDNGLTKLHALTSLTTMELNQSQVTAAGLAKFQAALPKCAVQSDVAGGSAGKLTTLDDPVFQQWLKQVAALPDVPQQTAAVAKKLQELNPQFDGKFGRVETSMIGATLAVTDVQIASPEVRDLSPLRAWPELKIVICAGIGGSDTDRCKLTDLSPLTGLKLISLECYRTDVSDLTPLTGMPLTKLWISETYVANLSPVAKMPLTHVDCSSTGIRDLAPLRGKSLTYLSCHNTAVTDLTPLRGMPLVTLRCEGTQISNLIPLHDCKQLTSLNVTNTKVTAAGVAALKKALPNCKVEWSEKK